MVSINIGGAVTGAAKLYTTIDSRSGGAVVIDGAGVIHRLQIMQPQGGSQDVYYAAQQPNDSLESLHFQPLRAGQKVYSVDGAAIQSVGGTLTIAFLIEFANGDGTQSKHAAHLEGVQVTPLAGGGSAGGLTLEQVRAAMIGWLQA